MWRAIRGKAWEMFWYTREWLYNLKSGIGRFGIEVGLVLLYTYICICGFLDIVEWILQLWIMKIVHIKSNWGIVLRTMFM